MALLSHASGRRKRRGVTLLETLIVLAFFGTLGSLVTLAVSPNARAKTKAALGFSAARPSPAAASAPSAGLLARERAVSLGKATLLYNSTKFWLDGRDASACPGVGRLVDDGLVVDPAHEAYDAWGNPFEVFCKDEEIFVYSAGPDDKLGTADDVVVPEGAAAADVAGVAATRLRRPRPAGAAVMGIRSIFLETGALGRARRTW